MSGPLDGIPIPPSRPHSPERSPEPPQRTNHTNGNHNGTTPLALRRPNATVSNGSSVPTHNHSAIPGSVPLHTTTFAARAVNRGSTHSRLGNSYIPIKIDENLTKSQQTIKEAKEVVRKTILSHYQIALEAQQVKIDGNNINSENYNEQMEAEDAEQSAPRRNSVDLKPIPKKITDLSVEDRDRILVTLHTNCKDPIRSLFYFRERVLNGKGSTNENIPTENDLKDQLHRLENDPTMSTEFKSALLEEFKKDMSILRY